VHDTDDRMATAAYQPEPRAAAAARRFVRDTLRTWRLGGPEPGRADLIDDAVLLTSELVTNAVVHAGTPVQVTCRLAESAVEVVVLDRHPVQLVPGRSRPGAGAADRTSGRGLLLPAELASSWGVIYARTAKAVWFRLGLNPDAPAAAPATPGSPGTAVAEPPPLAAPAPSPQPGPRAALPVPAAPAGGQAVPVGGAAVPAGGAADLAAGAAAPAVPVGGAAGAAAPVGGTSALAGGAAGAAGPSGPLPVLASRALGRIGYEELLSHTADAARAMLAADAAYLLAPGEDGELRVRAAAGAGPSGAADLGPLATGTGAGAAAAARDLAEAAKSLVTVPLMTDGRVTGVLAAAAAEPDQFSDQDSARLQALADRAAPALEEARLGEADRAAEARARFLGEAARLLDGSLSRERIAELTAQLVVPRLADWCALLLPGPGGALTPACLMHADVALTDALAWLLGHAPPPPCPGPDSGPGEPGLDPEAEPDHDPGPGPVRPAGRPGVRWPLTRPGPAGARDGDPEPDGAANLAADGAWLFPLTAGTQPLGLLAVAGLAGARLPADAAELIAGLARRAALALTAVRPAGSPPPGRSAPAAVPRPEPPRIPGVDLAVAHEHPAGCAEPGGDFCDVFPAGPGRWRFVLADVCGTGREAAAISGLARNALRILAREGYGVAEVLERLNELILDEGEQARFVTLVHGEITAGPPAGVSLACAGHPQPLLLRAAGGPPGPAAEVQPLLGALSGQPFAAQDLRLDPGDLLLMVSDGVTKRRDGYRLLDDAGGLARLFGPYRGQPAGLVASGVAQAAREFGGAPLAGDLALLVLGAT
jgi:anti-sigma regulatory factor (Ser/Thr protein kinase)